MQKTAYKLVVSILLVGSWLTLNAQNQNVHAEQAQVEQTEQVQEQQQRLVDMLIFSFDRPLQLYALLESIEKYMTGLSDIHVIYRASNDEYARAYDEVHQTFNNVHFVVQGAEPQKDFKPLTLQSIKAMPSEHIIFAVDDIIVKDEVDLGYCADMLEQTNAYGFYLRLGLHTDYCYALSRDQGVPVHTHVQDDVYSWRFAGSRGDWAYPHTVDMTVYRKKDVLFYFERMPYRAPNSLEGRWAGQAGRVINRNGLFFADSKMVNVPLNLVQQEGKNRNMNFMTPRELLQQFDEGNKIDIMPLYRTKNKSAHMEYKPTFVVR